jgi:hypothetical protein
VRDVASPELKHKSLQSPQSPLSPRVMSDLSLLPEGDNFDHNLDSDVPLDLSFMTPDRSTSEVPAKRGRSPSRSPVRRKLSSVSSPVASVGDANPDDAAPVDLAASLKKIRTSGPVVLPLTKKLSKFEYERIYSTLRYQTQLMENMGARLAQFIENEFYNAVNARVIKSDAPLTNNEKLAELIQGNLPSKEKMQEKADAIAQLFGPHKLGAPTPEELAPIHPRQNRERATFKAYVNYFMNEIWSFRGQVLPPAFQFMPKILNVSSVAIATPFIKKMNDMENDGAQNAFSRNPENLEALLLSGLGNDAALDFCLDDDGLDYWQHLTADVSPEVKEFVLLHYRTPGKPHHPKDHPFYLAAALYDFQCDLTRMHLRLTELLEFRLTGCSHHEWTEALAVIWDFTLSSEEMKRQDLISIHYLANEPRLDEFLASSQVPLSQGVQLIRPRQSFLQDIEQKSFPDLMRTLFHGYGRLLMDFYNFTNFYNLAKAQQFVFSNLPSIDDFQETAILKLYRGGLDCFSAAKQDFERIHDQYYHALDNFFAEIPSYSSIPSVKALLDDHQEMIWRFSESGLVEDGQLAEQAEDVGNELTSAVAAMPLSSDGNLKRVFKSSVATLKFDFDSLVHLLTELSLMSGLGDDDEQKRAFVHSLTQLKQDLYLICRAGAEFYTKNQQIIHELEGLKSKDTAILSDQLIIVNLPAFLKRFQNLNHSASTLIIKLIDASCVEIVLEKSKAGQSFLQPLGLDDSFHDQLPMPALPIIRRIEMLEDGLLFIKSTDLSVSSNMSLG